MIVNLKIRIEMTNQQVSDFCTQYGCDPSQIKTAVRQYAENAIANSAGLSDATVSAS